MLRRYSLGIVESAIFSFPQATSGEFKVSHLRITDHPSTDQFKRQQINFPCSDFGILILGIAITAAFITNQVTHSHQTWLSPIRRIPKPERLDLLPAWGSRNWDPVQIPLYDLTRIHVHIGRGTQRYVTVINN